MKAILSLCTQDFKRLLTHALFWVLTVTLLLIVLVVNFALPSEIAPESHRIVTYGFPADSAYGQSAASEEALRQAVSQGDAIGLLASGDTVTLLHPGLSDKTVRALLLGLNDQASQDIPIRLLGEPMSPVAFNLHTVPILVCFEALMVGFILGGALMLAEKEDGTVYALRVAPIGAVKYLMAKTLLFCALGTAYAALITVGTVGVDIAWGIFLPLVFLGTAIFTLLGLAYTTFFREMSGWFFLMVVLLGINMLPAIPYESPAFSPFWMRWIPSYPLLFALEKALFGGAMEWGYTLVSVTLWLIAVFFLAWRLAAKNYLKGVKA